MMSEHEAKQPQPAASSSAVGAVDAALGSRSGVALGNAHVHDDATSHAAADALGAKAFTAGSNVFMGAGQAGGPGGDALLAHEMAHVSQMQGVAAPQPGNFRVSDPSDHAEGAARGGGGGAGQSHTIYRDVTGVRAPATGCTGPAAAMPPAGGTGPA